MSGCWDIPIKAREGKRERAHRLLPAFPGASTRFFVEPLLLLASCGTFGHSAASAGGRGRHQDSWAGCFFVF